MGNETAIEDAKELIDAGGELAETWWQMPFMEPPDGIIDRIIWTLGVFAQLIISVFTFPAAMAAFLLEEAVQSYGMGAYLLFQSKAYEPLLDYLTGYRNFIDSSEISAKSMATLSPITGGAVILYMQAAREQHQAFVTATNAKWMEQAEKDQKAREKLLEQQKYGELRLTSTPDNAEIWMDNTNTELLTPETFTKLEKGIYIITLRKYSATRETWDIYTFEVDIDPGIRKEIQIRIPPSIQTDNTDPDSKDEQTESRLPSFIKAQVKGDHAIDGDTFQTISGERIRLLAIDAPELGRPFSTEAKEALQLMIEDKNIELRIQTTRPKDTYGRTLAICTNYKGDISTFLLSSGLAKTYIGEDDIYDPTKYQAAEQIAKDRQIGIWS